MCFDIQGAKIRKKSSTAEIILIHMHKVLKFLAVLMLLVTAALQDLHAQYDKDMFMMRGRQALSDGKYALAIENFNVLSQLDTADYWTFFFRGIAKYNLGDLRGAKTDFDRSVRLNPVFTNGYHYRGITESRFGNYDEALNDLQKAIDLRPGYEGLYFSRGVTYFLAQQFDKAIKDFDRYIRREPKDPSAYLNRGASYLFLGDTLKAVNDYNKAIKLDRFDPEGYVRRGRLYASQGEHDLAIEDMNKAIELDTTKKYSSLLSLDAEFAKKDFNDELLQHRDIDIRLRSFYKFVLTGEKDNTSYALNRRYENSLVARFENSVPVGLDVMNDEVALTDAQLVQVEAAGWSEPVTPEKLFLRALYDSNGKQFNSAMNYYTQAIEKAEDEAAGYDALYSAFYHMNRGVLRAEMIEFISSIENNVQVLAMDDSGNTRARVRDQVVRQYDYTDAIEDMKRVAELVPILPYAYFNLGNLYCLSSEHINSIENYTKAISLYPYMGDAYFNRGLVLIYLKDKEKGCIDLSRAGELGVQDAYGVIKKYCEDENE